MMIAKMLNQKVNVAERENIQSQLSVRTTKKELYIYKKDTEWREGLNVK
jgi:hypothetical protein